MSARTHGELAGFIWDICNLLRGPYMRNEYRKVILPLTVLRCFDCVLEPTKQAVLAAAGEHRDKTGSVRRQLLETTAGRSFYNTSRLDFRRLSDDSDNLASNLNGYIRGFSGNVREIMERFGCSEQIARMDEEAGEHFTPREVIELMVALLLSPEPDLGCSHVVKTIYDPACGTGGMPSATERYLRDHNSKAKPILFGQDHNDEAWAVRKSDMLIKGENADNIILGDTFTRDGYRPGESDRP